MKIVIVILIFMSSLLAQVDLEKVSLQLKWKYQFQFAGFIVAKEKGFYEERGLDVTLKEFDSSTDIIKEVEEGKVAFGISDSSLILESMKGSPVVAMMAIFQQSPFVLMGLKSKELKNIEDIEGKNVALFKTAQGITIDSMLKSKGISYNRKSERNKFDKLLNHKIDLISAYITNEVYVAKELGLDVVTFNPRDYGFDAYGDILFTSENMLKSNPEFVDKMYSATMKGWKYAFTHLDETVELIYKKYNTLHKTREALRYEAKILKTLSGYGKNFGAINREKVRSLSQIFSFMVNDNYNLSHLSNFIYKEKDLDDTLTQEELDYLKNKKIKVCVHPNMYPLEFIEEGKYKGMSSDYMHILSKNHPFNFELVLAKNDKEVFQNIAMSKCDLKPSVLHKYNLVSEYMNETELVNAKPFVLLTRNDKPFISSIEQLKGKKIAVKGEYYKKFLTAHYPSLDIVVIRDLKKIIALMKKDELFGYLEASIYANAIIEKYGFTMLKVNMKLLPHMLRLVMGVSKQEPQLLVILNKLLKKVSKDEKNTIVKKWSIEKYHTIIDYSLVWKIVAISVFIIVIILYWMLKYKGEIKRRKVAEKKLQYLNASLENKVKIEIKKNKKQQLIIFQQTRLAQMGEMLSMIAHQWRQPLAAINATSNTLYLKSKLGKLDTKEALKLSQNISSYSQHLSHTIDDFRDFFKPHKEKNETTYTKIIASVLGIIESSLTEKNIQLKQNLNCNEPFSIYSNEVKQVILNLIKNAEDALVERAIKDPTIEISSYTREERYILEISDNAGGVPEDIIGKIFDPYFSTKKDKEGTGLGLYMSKIIIEEHCAGTLNISNTKKGAKFIISFT